MRPLLVIAALVVAALALLASLLKREPGAVELPVVEASASGQESVENEPADLTTIVQAPATAEDARLPTQGASPVAITGRVVDEVEGNERIEIAVLLPPGADFESLRPLDQGTCGAGGAFRLELPGPGTYVVVASAEERRPASTAVVVEAGTVPEPLLLTLDEGLAITGHVLVNGQPCTSGSVVASIGGGPRLDSLRWAPSTFELQMVHVSCDQDGAFRISCLGPHEYSLSAFADGARADMRVRAPSDGVTLDLRSVTYEIVVRCGGRFLDGVTARLRQIPPRGLSGAMQTGIRERWAFRADPANEYEVQIARAGYETRTLRLTNGQPALSEIDLQPAEPLATIRVTVTCSTGTPPERVGLLAESFREGPSFRRTLDLVDGVALMTEIPPGRYDLQVRAGSDPYLLVGHDYITVPSSGEVPARVTLPTGGRLLLLRQENALSIEVVVRDADMRVVRMLRAVDEPSVDLGPFVPGTYGIQVSADGFASEVFEATIEPGATTELSPVLTAK